MKLVKWRLIACLTLVICMALPVVTAVSADSTTNITGTVASLLQCSDVRATDIGYYGATILWETNLDATSQVFYDTVSRTDIGDYRYDTDEDPTLVTEHSVRLTGLRSGTRYYYQVKSTASGNATYISAEYTFTTRTPHSSPQPSTLQLQVIVEGKLTTHPISDEGEVLERIERTSSDGKMTIIIAEGTIALDKDGNPLRTLTVDAVPDPPPPPEGVHIIGLAYHFGPPGATCNPHITVTWQYNPVDIPEGMAEENLIVAYYDEEMGRWVEVPAVIDVATNTITAQVAYFTTFAIIAAPPVQYDLTISSTSGGLVTTPGEGTFTYEKGTVVNLVASPESGYRLVKWTGNVGTVANVNAVNTTITMNGNYSITANFAKVPPLLQGISWLLMGVIIAAAVVVGLVLFFLRRKRK
jgi:hypothetical protein